MSGSQRWRHGGTRGSGDNQIRQWRKWPSQSVRNHRLKNGRNAKKAKGKNDEKEEPGQLGGEFKIQKIKKSKKNRQGGKITPERRKTAVEKSQAPQSNEQDWRTTRGWSEPEQAAPRPLTLDVSSINRHWSVMVPGWECRTYGMRLDGNNDQMEESTSVCWTRSRKASEETDARRGCSRGPFPR
ncbi:hypothetical protein PDE_00033 [Penicillium oxalicum 114-2]|uniref:Uncharacterized protein n=1 Tax=Penicillium oxalicum (strain 114-2 / CGMCC 5302) TaxID=933388 RepID=S8ATF5_PENO1|nr:hypothetical protein PDE_00033 [Penicillium oxalicum 114-2]